MRRKTERQGTEAERQLAWSREYLRREKRRRVLRRTLLMLVLALACAVTVFALNCGIPALREGYTFEGWYRDAARTDAWDFAADTVEQDTILYAKWEAVPAQDTTSGAALPQTGVATGALLWACVLAAALALAAAAALLLRRAYRG